MVRYIKDLCKGSLINRGSTLVWTPIGYKTLHITDRRGAALLRGRNCAEITHFCVWTEVAIRYGFHAGAKAIRYSVNEPKSKLWYGNIALFSRKCNSVFHLASIWDEGFWKKQFLFCLVEVRQDPGELKQRRRERQAISEKGNNFARAWRLVCTFFDRRRCTTLFSNT